MTSPFDLSGRVAIVTGTSRGLGQAFARALARAGADIIITSRSIDTLRPFEEEIAALGRRAVPLELDVRDEASIRRMADAAQDAFGRIDILVNNAGCNVRKRAADVTWDDWNLVLDTNLRGTFFTSQAVVRHMLPQRYGRIVNIGSVTTVFGYSGLAPYGASRGGIRQMTMSLADDWGPHGITVNCLAPGWFRTDQNKVMYDDAEWLAYLVDRIPLRVRGARRTSKARLSFWHRTRACTSPARRSWSMAGYDRFHPGPATETRGNRRCRRRLPCRRAWEPSTPRTKTCANHRGRARLGPNKLGRLPSGRRQ